jgi:putative peptidoglycan lipid II flippase
MTPLFPLIAKLVSEDREADALSAFRRVAGLLGLVSVPMMLLLAIYADETAQLAFQRGKCDAACIDEIAPPLQFYAFALWPAFGALLMNRTLSAARRQRFILIATAVTVALTIVLDVILLGPLEQAGLALASTLGVYASAVMLMGGLRNQFPSLSIRVLARRQGAILVAGAISAAAALALDRVVPTGGKSTIEMLPGLVGKVAVALAVYYLATRLLARAELAEGVRSLRSLVARRERGR